MTERRPLRAALAPFVAAAVVALAGCGGVPKMPDVETPPRGDGKTPEQARTAFERIDTEAVTVLEADIRELLPTRLGVGDTIPDRTVGPIFVEDMPALELLRILVRPHDIAVVPSPGLSDVTITLLDPKKRPIGEAVAMIADQADLFYRYQDGVLRIDDKRDFSVTLPNMSEVADLGGDEGGTDEGVDFLESFRAAFEGMGAQAINVDGDNGVISFEADRRAYRRVAEYVKKVAEEKAVLVYDTWIYSVDLQEEVGLGIDFTKLSGSLGDLGDVEVQNAQSVLGDVGKTGLGTEMGLGGIALSLSDLSIGSIAIDAILSFLDNQGKIKALSKPSLTMTSGRAADIFVGRKRNYIRKVTVETFDGTDDDDDDDDDDDSRARIIPDIDELDLGVGMALAGNYNNGIITSDLRLRISSLIQLEEKNFSNDDQEVQLQLPETSERSLNTEITSRPGDIIVLGGLIEDNGALRGQDLMTVPLSRKETKNRTELVIIMRPRLVLMRPKGHPDFIEHAPRSAQPERPDPADTDPQRKPAPDVDAEGGAAGEGAGDESSAVDEAAGAAAGPSAGPADADPIGDVMRSLDAGVRAAPMPEGGRAPKVANTTSASSGE